MRVVSADLKDFSLWLINEKLVNKRTTSVYTSHVRSVLASCSDSSKPTQAEVNTYFGGLEDKRVSGIITSWRKYIEWVRHETGRDVPEPKLERKARNTSTTTHYTLPLDVAAALYFCIRNCSLRLADIEQVMWGFVTGGKVQGRSFVRLKASDKTSIAIPNECIEVFRTFAQPKNLYAPLVPWFGGCQFPMSVQRLKKEVLAYEQLRVRAEQEGVKLDCFDPFEACASFLFDVRNRMGMSNPLPEGVNRVVDFGEASATPTPRPSTPTPVEPLSAKLDVPLSQSITTADLLARLTPRREFVLDFGNVERRTSDYPGDWRYLYGEDVEDEDEG